MRRYKLVIVAVFGLIVPAYAEFETAIDMNAPINTSTGAIRPQMQASKFAALGVNRVRLNCILGPWNSPGDSTLHSGKTWFQTYDQIVNDLVGQNIQIYMLIGAEAVDTVSPLNSTAYCDTYAANFETIVDHFKDRVRVYESFNEPNDWAGGSSAQVQPRYFAYMLQEIYLNVKHRDGHAGVLDWQVTLASGPMFTHDIGGDGDLGDAYFIATANAGKNGDAAIPALDWNNVKTLTGSYPYDGMGYHIYVLLDSTDTAAITARINQHLSAMMNAVDTIEGNATHGKKIWISEISWPSNTVGLEGQANNLDHIMSLFRSDSRVRMGGWFCTYDFDPTQLMGIWTSDSLLDSQRKPACWHLRWQSLIGSGAGNTANNASFETAGGGPWSSFGQTDGVISGSWFAGITARSGSKFWGAAANFGTKNGGAYQQFVATPGQAITAGTWVRTYREGGSSGDTACRIGIDPAGGTNPAAAGIVWSELLENQGTWRPLCIRTNATAAQVTVFLQHNQQAPTWNVTCFDDVVVQGAVSAIPVTVSQMLAE